MFCFRSCYVFSILAAMAIIFCQTTLSQAISISITPNPPSRTVPEDQSGAFNFTVQNISLAVVEVRELASEQITVADPDPDIGNTRSGDEGD